MIRKILSISVLIAAILACSSATSQPAPQPQQVITQVVITQVITQVVSDGAQSGLSRPTPFIRPTPRPSRPLRFQPKLQHSLQRQKYLLRPIYSAFTSPVFIWSMSILGQDNGAPQARRMVATPH